VDNATHAFDAGAYYGVRARDAVLRVYKKPLRFGLYGADNRTRIWQEELHADVHGRTVVEVGASVGSYAGKPDARSYTFTVHGRAAEPAKVRVAGRQAEFTYEQDTKVVTVTTPRLPLDRGFTVELTP
jgi:hypothetical protein